MELHPFGTGNFGTHLMGDHKKMAQFLKFVNNSSYHVIQKTTRDGPSKQRTR